MLLTPTWKLPKSPTYGQRAAVSAKFHREENRFIGPNWLSLLPLPGAPLRQLTTYAAIVTAGVRAQTGGALAVTAVAPAATGTHGRPAPARVSPLRPRP